MIDDRSTSEIFREAPTTTASSGACGLLRGICQAVARRGNCAYGKLSSEKLQVRSVRTLLPAARRLPLGYAAFLVTDLTTKNLKPRSPTSMSFSPGR